MPKFKKIDNTGALSNDKIINARMSKIEKSEGMAKSPYIDPVGVPTIAGGVALGGKDDKKVQIYSFEKVNDILSSNGQDKMSKKDYETLATTTEKWNSSSDKTENARDAINSNLETGVNYKLEKDQAEDLTRKVMVKKAKEAEAQASMVDVDLKSQSDRTNEVVLDQYFRGGKNLVLGENSPSSNEALRTNNQGKFINEVLHRSNKEELAGVDTRNEENAKYLFDGLSKEEQEKVYKDYVDSREKTDISKHQSRRPDASKNVFGDFESNSNTEPKPTQEKPTKTFEKAPSDKSSSTEGIGSKVGDFAGKLGAAGLGFLNKIAKVSDAVHDATMKQPHDLTQAERDTLMTSPTYKDKKDPLFHTVQKQVEDSFKWQYPGKSRGYHNIQAKNILPRETQPIRDTWGNDIKPAMDKVYNKIASESDATSEGSAVRNFQDKLNKLPWDDGRTWKPLKGDEFRITGINKDVIIKKSPEKNDTSYPSLNPSRPLKTDGVFGPKTNNRTKEAVAKFGVDAVDSWF